MMYTMTLYFLYCGLPSRYRIPIGYFFASSLSGKQLRKLNLHAIKLIEEAGFIVLRIVADIAKVHVDLFNDLCDKNMVSQIHLLLLVLREGIFFIRL